MARQSATIMPPSLLAIGALPPVLSMIGVLPVTCAVRLPSSGQRAANPGLLPSTYIISW